MKCWEQGDVDQTVILSLFLTCVMTRDGGTESMTYTAIPLGLLGLSRESMESNFETSHVTRFKNRRRATHDSCTWSLRKLSDLQSPGGGDSHMKQTGMLVVSLRGVNFRFWSRLGCSGQNANILSRQGLVQGSAKSLRFMTMLLKTTIR